MKKNSEKKEESKPRYKALIKLGMYILFFSGLFLIAYISSAFNTTTNNNGKKNNSIDVIENFKYKYTISIKKIII